MSRLKLTFIVLIVLATLAGVSSAAYLHYTLDHNRIVEGVTMREVDLSGLTQPEAIKKLKQYQVDYLEQPVEIKVGEKTWQTKLGDLSVQLNNEAMAKAAYGVGRAGNWLEQWQTRKRVAEQGLEIPLEAKLDSKKAAAHVTKQTAELIIEPVDAAVRVTADDLVQIVPGKSGRAVDVAPVREQLEAIVLAEGQPQLTLSTKEVQPSKTEADIQAMGIKAVVSQYSSTFDATNTNRTYNLQVAATALNGLIVKPGETVSFNDIVGPRSSEAGYKEAPVIVNNELVPGLGGGVCQVSTTLYNSLLVGGFEIVERQNHSMPVSYVPKGRDATVAYGYIDFKFKNNRQGHIYVKAQISGNRIVFKILGDPGENSPVEIVDNVEKVIPFETVYKNDPNLLKGQEVVKEKGRSGYRVTTVRLIKQKGQIIKREVVTKSYYKPKNRIVHRGTKLPAMTTVPAPAAPTDGAQPQTQPQGEAAVGQ